MKKGERDGGQGSVYPVRSLVSLVLFPILSAHAFRVFQTILFLFLFSFLLPVFNSSSSSPSLLALITFPTRAV